MCAMARKPGKTGLSHDGFDNGSWSDGPAPSAPNVMRHAHLRAPMRWQEPPRTEPPWRLPGQPGAFMSDIEIRDIEIAPPRDGNSIPPSIAADQAGQPVRKSGSARWFIGITLVTGIAGCIAAYAPAIAVLERSSPATALERAPIDNRDSTQARRPSKPREHRLDASAIAQLLKRGAQLVANGNIGAARMMFQPAAEAGDPAAAFALAETYDPLVLEHLRAKGINSDIALARQWYAKAKSLGSTAAPERLARLTR